MGERRLEVHYFPLKESWSCPSTFLKNKNPQKQYPQDEYLDNWIHSLNSSITLQIVGDP